jgi:uncharacterized protein (TIGR03083 family)
MSSFRAADHSGTVVSYNICELAVICVGFCDEHGCRTSLKEPPVTSQDIPAEIGALLASLTELTPSNDTSTLLHAALTARAATSLQAPPTDNEAAAFARAVDDVQHTLSLLTASDWTLPAVNGLTVGELVGHLIGTQLLMVAELGLDDTLSIETRTIDTTSTEHVESTRAAITAGRNLSPAEAAAEFARVSTLLISHFSGLDAQALATESRYGAIVADLGFLLLVRVFELWTHDNDLRGSVGLERVEPDADRLWMMTRAVMPVVHRTGGDHLRIVLTGAGGGVWPAPNGEIAEIAVDSIAFCRRVANRLAVDDLEVDISGDAAAAHETLSELATLALD